jgi:hypothetical protein
MTPLVMTFRCDTCRRLFAYRKNKTIHIQFVSKINTTTGAAEPIDEWIDFCSHACHDVALKRGTVSSGETFARFTKQ